MSKSDGWRQKKSGTVYVHVGGKAWKMMNDVHKNMGLNKTEQIVTLMRKYFPDNYPDYLDLMRESILKKIDKQFEEAKFVLDESKKCDYKSRKERIKKFHLEKVNEDNF